MRMINFILIFCYYLLFKKTNIKFIIKNNFNPSRYHTGSAVKDRSCCCRKSGGTVEASGKVVTVKAAGGEDTAGDIAPQSGMAVDVDFLLRIEAIEVFTQLIQRNVQRHLRKMAVSSVFPSVRTSRNRASSPLAISSISCQWNCFTRPERTFSMT